MIRPVLGKAYDRTGIATQKRKPIRIYPNPTQDILYFDNIENLENTTCQLFDIYGKLLQTKSIDHNGLHLGEYADGIYFVRIIQNNQIIATEKIIKK